MKDTCIFRKVYPEDELSTYPKTSVKWEGYDNLFKASGSSYWIVCKGIAWVESRYRENAVSPKGAVGVMQLMPLTAIDLGLSLTPDDERRDHRKNIDAGCRYLLWLYNYYRQRAFSRPLSFAVLAYNAGVGRVERTANGLNRDLEKTIKAMPKKEQREYYYKVGQACLPLGFNIKGK